MQLYSEVRNKIKSENIPQQLKALNRWCCWKFIKKVDGNGSTIEAKIPVQTNNLKASSTDPKTWCSFEQAYKHYCDRPAIQGLFFAMGTDGLVGGDIDDIVWNDNRSAITPDVQEIIDRFDTYTEFSPSGDGIRWLCLAICHKKAERISHLKFITLLGFFRSQVMSSKISQSKKIKEQLIGFIKPTS